MTWPVVIFLSILITCVARVLTEWVKAREQRISQAEKRIGCQACEGARNLEIIEARPLVSKAGELAYQQTIVLKRCRACGVHYHYCHPGEWSTEDFLKRQADVNWLRGQVG